MWWSELDYLGLVHEHTDLSIDICCDDDHVHLACFLYPLGVQAFQYGFRCEDCLAKLDIARAERVTRGRVKICLARLIRAGVVRTIIGKLLLCSMVMI